ncbi:unnamed protein product [Hermetia illucens]|uniref:Uncharacterized protein n=1 Tax=Hermetia illucens TaxID=343691 RepID=A0A7R8V181_HERIL|nr:unnamed protein product [Hermetia illucens]
MILLGLRQPHVDEEWALQNARTHPCSNSNVHSRSGLAKNTQFRRSNTTAKVEKTSAIDSEPDKLQPIQGNIPWSQYKYSPHMGSFQQMKRM